MLITVLIIWLIFQGIIVHVLTEAGCKSEDMCNKIMWMPAFLRWIIFTVPSLIVWANQ